MIVHHRVGDYGTWRAVYDSADDLRQQHGCTGAEVLVDPGDKQDVYVFHRFPSLEQAQAFASSDELKRGMASAGVVGAPRIEFAVEA
jgi:hypothetical protein